MSDVHRVLLRLVVIWVGILMLQGCALLDWTGWHWRSVPPVEPMPAFQVLRGPGGPFGQFEDGRRFPLIDRWSALEKLEPLPLRCAKDGQVPPFCTFPTLHLKRPTSVDLRGDQTALRSQGGRNTCQTFATVAAIEAAYKRRFRLELDLSEQYLNHVDKMWIPNGRPLPGNEDIAGAVGGRNPTELLGLLTQWGYGVPPESTLPYISNGSYETPDGAQDKPDIMDWAHVYTQREVDDFNLSEQPQDYLIPQAVRAISLPQAALEQARYRPTKVATPPAGSLRDVLWYMDELIAHRDVIVAYEVGPGVGHVVLLVGYDEIRRAFMVKDSNNDATFNWFGFDQVASIYEAASIVEVADPYSPFGAYDNPQLFLGRWNVMVDGVAGVLDLYRLRLEPDDLRLGTFFPVQGSPMRVNGRISRHRLDLFIDSTAPDQAPNAQGGKHFEAYLFSSDHRTLAGTAIGPNVTAPQGFLAMKDSVDVGVPRTGNQVPAERYLGHWAVNRSGLPASLHVTAIGVGNTLTGTYSEGGLPWSISGRVNPDGGVSITTAPGLAPLVFHGYIHGSAPGLLSGTVLSGGWLFGFSAVRQTQ